jgi:predicted transcriptional regulator
MQLPHTVTEVDIELPVSADASRYLGVARQHRADAEGFHCASKVASVGVGRELRGRLECVIRQK